MRTCGLKSRGAGSNQAIVLKPKLGVRKRRLKTPSRGQQAKASVAGVKGRASQVTWSCPLCKYDAHGTTKAIYPQKRHHVQTRHPLEKYGNLIGKAQITQWPHRRPTCQLMLGRGNVRCAPRLFRLCPNVRPTWRYLDIEGKNTLRSTLRIGNLPWSRFGPVGSRNQRWPDRVGPRLINFAKSYGLVMTWLKCIANAPKLLSTEIPPNFGALDAWPN